MKKNLILLALLTVPLFSAQPNPLPGVGLQSAEYFESYDQQVQSAAQKPDLILHNDPTFFTGKHYDQDLGAYVFKYRNYSPDSNRWTSADPSGFPDGPNNYAYAPVPTSELDWQGLAKVNFTMSARFLAANINISGAWVYSKGTASVSILSVTGVTKVGASVGGVGVSDELKYVTFNSSRYDGNIYIVDLGVNIIHETVLLGVTTSSIYKTSTFNIQVE